MPGVRLGVWIGVVVFAGLMLLAGVSLALYYGLLHDKSQKDSGSVLHATTWTNLKLDPKYQSNDPSHLFSSFKNALSALPHKTTAFPLHSVEPLVGLPTQFYYQQCNLVPQQNQGTCNTCTVFATFSMLASRLALIRGSVPQMLSVQQYLDCKPWPCATPQPISNALDFSANVGVVQAQYYAYEMVTQPKCLITDGPPFNVRVFSSPVQGLSPYEPFVVGDAAHLRLIQVAMTEIYSFGPICTVLAIHQDLLQSYRATAYAADKSYTGAIYVPAAVDNPLLGYHAIQIIGWIKPDVKTFHEACWVCVSSWANWPPSPWPTFPGIFFMAMGINNCGMESQMVTAHPLEVVT